MNILEETNDYYLSRLKEEIEHITQTYKSTSDNSIRKNIRKKYKELINKYHSFTGIKVWNSTL